MTNIVKRIVAGLLIPSLLTSTAPAAPISQTANVSFWSVKSEHRNLLSFTNQAMQVVLTEFPSNRRASSRTYRTTDAAKDFSVVRFSFNFNAFHGWKRGRRTSPSPISDAERRGTLRNEILSEKTTVDRFAELLSNTEDLGLRLLIFKQLEHLADTQTPASKANAAALQARQILIQTSRQELAAPDDPAQIREFHGRSDTRETARLRIWKLVATGHLIDPRRPVLKPTSEQINEEIRRLQTHKDVVRTVETMVAKQMDGVDSMVDEYQKSRTGIVGGTNYTGHPAAFEAEIASIFDSVVRASGLDPEWLDLHLIDDPGKNGFVRRDILDRIFISVPFLSYALRENSGIPMNRDILAGLMAHELSHLISRFKRISLNESAVGQNKPYDLESSTRHAEEDYADFLAVRIADAAGYDSGALGTLLRDVAPKERERALFALLAHPPADGRSRDIERHLHGVELRNRRKLQAPFDSVTLEALDRFEGSYYGLTPYSHDPSMTPMARLDEHLRAAFKRSQERIGSSEEYHRRLVELNADLQEAIGLLSGPLSYNEWRAFWDDNDLWDKSIHLNLRHMLVGTFEGSRGLSESAGNTGLLEQARERFDHLETLIADRGRRLNSAHEWWKHKMNDEDLSSREGQTDDIELINSWRNHYREEIRSRLAGAPAQVLRDMAAGQIAKPIVVDLLLEDPSTLNASEPLYWTFVQQAITGIDLTQENIERLRERIGRALKEPNALKIWSAISRVLTSLSHRHVPSHDEDGARSFWSGVISQWVYKAGQGALFTDWLIADASTSVSEHWGYWDFGRIGLFDGALLRMLDQERWRDWWSRGNRFQSLLERNSESYQWESIAQRIAATNAEIRYFDVLDKSRLYAQLLRAQSKLPSSLSMARRIIRLYELGGFLSASDLAELISHETDAEALGALRQTLSNLGSSWKQPWLKAAKNREDHHHSAQHILDNGLTDAKKIVGLAELAARTQTPQVRYEYELSDDVFLSLRSWSNPTFDTNYFHRIQTAPVRHAPSVAQVIAESFPFLSSSMPNEALIDTLIETLPPSPYRNYALYLTFAVRVLKVPSQKAFDRETVKEALQLLSVDQRETEVGRITQAMVYDNKNSLGNRGAMVQATLSSNNGFILRPDEEVTHAAGQVGWLDAFFHPDVGDRLENQLDLFLWTLEREIDADASPFNHRPSGQRDIFLAAQADDLIAALSADDVLAPLEILWKDMHGDMVRERYALKLLDLHVSVLRKRLPGDDHRLERVYEMEQLILRFFPEPSLTRDDLLDSLIETEVRRVPEYRSLAHLYSSVYGSDGRSVDEKKATGDELTQRNFAFYVLNRIPLREQRIQTVLWLMGLAEKPNVLKKLELTTQMNFDSLRESSTPQDLENFSHIGKSAQRQLIQQLLWDENAGVFADLKTGAQWRPTAEWSNLLGTIFEGIFGAQRNSTIIRDLWDIFFRIAPKISWVLTEKVLINLLTAIARAKQSTKGPLDEKDIAVYLLASCGVVGMKLGQLLHSFGYLDADFAERLEKLKYDSPDPLLKRDLFRSMEYAGLDEVEVLEKVGEASIKATYRVRIGVRIRAMKFMKPAAPEEARAGLAIIQEGLPVLRARLAERRTAFRYPLLDWPFRFLARSLDEELNLATERGNAAQMSRSIEYGWRWWAYAKLLWVYHGYTGSWLAVWNIIRRYRQRVGSDWTVKILVPEDVSGHRNFLFEEFADGERFSADESSESDGAAEAAAERFVFLLAQPKSHSDLHEGNILKSRIKKVLWFLDTGSSTSQRLGDLRRAAQLFRTIESGDATETAHLLATFYEAINQGDILPIVQAALTQPGTPVERIFYMLREINGSPTYGFLQLMKTLSTAGFILRRLNIGATSDRASQESPTAQAVSTLENPEPPSLDHLSVRELLAVARYEPWAPRLESALNRLVIIAETQPQTLTDLRQELHQEKKLESEGLPAKALLDIVMNPELAYGLRGKAFRLLQALTQQGFVNNPGVIASVSTDLTQKCLSEGWLLTDPSQTDHLDFLQGLLWIQARAGEPSDISSDVMYPFTTRLRSIALNDRYAERLRAEAARILAYRVTQDNRFPTAVDLVGEILQHFRNTPSEFIEERLWAVILRYGRYGVFQDVDRITTFIRRREIAGDYWPARTHDWLSGSLSNSRLRLRLARLSGFMLEAAQEPKNDLPSKSDLVRVLTGAEASQFGVRLSRVIQILANEMKDFVLEDGDRLEEITSLVSALLQSPEAQILRSDSNQWNFVRDELTRINLWERMADLMEKCAKGNNPQVSSGSETYMNSLMELYFLLWNSMEGAAFDGNISTEAADAWRRHLEPFFDPTKNGHEDLESAARVAKALYTTLATENFKPGSVTNAQLLARHSNRIWIRDVYGTVLAWALTLKPRTLVFFQGRFQSQPDGHARALHFDDLMLQYAALSYGHIDSRARSFEWISPKQVPQSDVDRFLRDCWVFVLNHQLHPDERQSLLENLIRWSTDSPIPGFSDSVLLTFYEAAHDHDILPTYVADVDRKYNRNFYEKLWLFAASHHLVPSEPDAFSRYMNSGVARTGYRAPAPRTLRRLLSDIVDDVTDAGESSLLPVMRMSRQLEHFLDGTTQLFHVPTVFIPGHRRVRHSRQDLYTSARAA